MTTASGREDAPGEFARWLEEARRGRAEALGRALEACRDYLLAVARGELDSDLVAKGGASDLVQETFLGAHRDFGQFRGRSGGELRAWLRGILLHRVGKFRRHHVAAGKRSTDREVMIGDGWPLLADDATTPSDVAERREYEEALVAALATLPERYRDVMTWKYRDGLSFEAIGDRLGVTPQAVRKLWGRAVLRLRRELGTRHAPG